MSKKHVPSQLAVTITDTSHVQFAGGDPVRRTILIDLTDEQAAKLTTESFHSGRADDNVHHRYEYVTSITVVEP